MRKKLTLVAMLAIFCFACEEKKVPLHPVAEIKWGTGKTNGDYATHPTHLVVTSGNTNSNQEYTRAVYQNKVLKIKYIGEKEASREPIEMENYLPNYETMKGPDYKIVHFLDTIGCEGTCGNRFFFLYNDSEKWGGVPENIVYNSYGHERPAAYEADIVAMENQQNGRKIIYSEVIANFYIDKEPYSLMLMGYENKADGLFQIVLRDHNYDYFTADYRLYDEKVNWQAGIDGNPGYWAVQFIGKVTEGLFIVTEWYRGNGNELQIFVAENGKLKLAN